MLCRIAKEVVVLEQEALAASTARLSAAAELAGMQGELKQLQQERGRTADQRASVLETCARLALALWRERWGIGSWKAVLVQYPRGACS